MPSVPAQVRIPQRVALSISIHPRESPQEGDIDTYSSISQAGVSLLPSTNQIGNMAAKRQPLSTDHLSLHLIDRSQSDRA